MAASGWNQCAAGHAAKALMLMPLGTLQVECVVLVDLVQPKSHATLLEAMLQVAPALRCGTAGAHGHLLCPRTPLVPTDTS